MLRIECMSIDVLIMMSKRCDWSMISRFAKRARAKSAYIILHQFIEAGLHHSQHIMNNPQRSQQNDREVIRTTLKVTKHFAGKNLGEFILSFPHKMGIG